MINMGKIINMAILNYKTKIPLPEEAYHEVINFLAPITVDSRLDWGPNDGFIYEGYIYYLDDSRMKAIRITPKKFFGLRKRRVELTDRVEQEIIDNLKDIITKKKMLA